MGTNYVAQNSTTVSAINEQLGQIQEALEDTLSRSGFGPNSMGSDLDMNSKKILNLPAPSSLNEPVRLRDLPLVQNVSTVSEATVIDNTLQMKSVDFNIGDFVICKRPKAGDELMDGLLFEIVAGGTGTADDVLFYDLLNGNQAKLFIKSTVKDTTPVFIEQFINGFGGRGMLDAETPSIVTETGITTSNSSGETAIGVTSSANFEIGSRVTIYHADDNKYETYFVSSKSASTLGFSTPLKFPVNTNSRIERTWYNQPHPGKFYMRSLAQRIARTPEYELKLPTSGRLYFSQFDGGVSVPNDLVTSVNGAGVSYVDELNISQGVLNVPVESTCGKSVFLSVDANGEGGELPVFNAYGITSVVLRFQLMCRQETAKIAVQLLDENGSVQTEIDIPNTNLRNPTVYTYPVKLSASTSRLTPRVIAKEISVATSVILDFFEVFETESVSTPVVPKDKPCVIVGLGDSWIAGDIISTPERESILTQLKLELPLANIINKGVGGEDIIEILARFDTDVAPFNPDYVVINTGTNDTYGPSSGVFFPNAVNEYERNYNVLIGKIMSIGAKPIIIGVPALAETDGAVTDWLLNDRVKTYSRYFYKRISGVVDYTQEIPDPVEPVITDFTPVLSIGGSTTGISYSTQSGKYTQDGRVVSFTVNLTLTSKGSSTGALTINMPPVTNAGGATPFSTTVFNVNSALGMQAVGSLGATADMRLQIPSATGSTVADETSINNNTIISISGSYLVTA